MDRGISHSQRGITPFISILIPVYNAENYLAQCLDSVKNQTLNNFECLMVNDGSSDSSQAIIDTYTQNDKRFRSITQKNKGLPAARNRIAKEATGEYLLFFDNDDFMEPEMLDTLYNRAKNDNLDIAICKFRYFDDQTHQYSDSKTRWDLTPEGIFSLKQSSKVFIGSCVGTTVWNKLLRHQMIRDNKISFHEGMFPVDDTLYSTTCFSYAKKIAFVDKVLVNYRINNANQGSSLKNLQKNPTIVVDCLEACRDVLNKAHVYDYQKDAFRDLSLEFCYHWLHPIFDMPAAVTFQIIKRFREFLGFFSDDNISENSFSLKEYYSTWLIFSLYEDDGDVLVKFAEMMKDEQNQRLLDAKNNEITTIRQEYEKSASWIITKPLRKLMPFPGKVHRTNPEQACK